MAVPEEPTWMAPGETAPMLKLKLGGLVTVTGTSTCLCSVLSVPVTVTVKVAVGELHVTDKTLNDETDSLQPVGNALDTDSETVPVNPLIGFTEIVDVPAVPAEVVMEDGLAESEKSTKWKVTELEVLIKPFPTPDTLTE